MTKYEVKSVVCDYGIYENNELKIIVNSQANALLIKDILEQDAQHKVVIEEPINSRPKPKTKRKFRAMTYREVCDRFEKDCKRCPFISEPCGLKIDMPVKLPNGKYILVEVKE